MLGGVSGSDGGDGKIVLDFAQVDGGLSSLEVEVPQKIDLSVVAGVCGCSPGATALYTFGCIPLGIHDQGQPHMCARPARQIPSA